MPRLGGAGTLADDCGGDGKDEWCVAVGVRDGFRVESCRNWIYKEVAMVKVDCVHDWGEDGGD